MGLHRQSRLKKILEARDTFLTVPKYCCDLVTTMTNLNLETLRVQMTLGHLDLVASQLFVRLCQLSRLGRIRQISWLCHSFFTLSYSIVKPSQH